MKILFILLFGLLALFALGVPVIPIISVAVCCAVIWSLQRKRCILRLGALLLLGIFFLTALPKAEAQVTDGAFVTLTNVPTQVTTTANSNINAWVKLYEGQGLGLTWKFNQTSASTSNAVLTVKTSVDGTNVSTVAFATISAASTGTTDVIVNTNWSAAQLSGANWLIIGNIANTTALTTLTNKLISVRRAN